MNNVVRPARQRASIAAFCAAGIALCAGGRLHASSLRLARDAESPPQTQSFAWEKGTFKGRLLTGVGGAALPTPLLFPANLIPLNRLVLVSLDHERHILALKMFYSPKDDAAFRGWLTGFPTAFPMAESEYGTLKPARIKTQSGLWQHQMTVQTSNAKVEVGGFSLQFRPSVLSKSVSDDFGRALFGAMATSPSPVKDMKGFEYLTVVYRGIETASGPSSI